MDSLECEFERQLQDSIRESIELGYNRMGHPELSVESIMLEAQFKPLFEEGELIAARWRLDRAKEDVRQDGE